MKTLVEVIKTIDDFAIISLCQKLCFTEIKKRWESQIAATHHLKSLFRAPISPRRSHNHSISLDLL